TTSTIATVDRSGKDNINIPNLEGNVLDLVSPNSFLGTNSTNPPNVVEENQDLSRRTMEIEDMEKANDSLRDGNNFGMASLNPDLEMKRNDFDMASPHDVEEGHLENIALVITNEQPVGQYLLNWQNSLASDSTFHVDCEYVSAENCGTPLDDERGLLCTKVPHDKGFHSED
ncbi:unnamed protein product, partial [Ilex paraguariensis]